MQSRPEIALCWEVPPIGSRKTCVSLRRHRCQVVTQLERFVSLLPEYQHRAGDYEVRYFTGDSFSGAGYVCRGMQQTVDPGHRQCALEAKVTSSKIAVTSAFADGTYQHLSA